MVVPFGCGEDGEAVRPNDIHGPWYVNWSFALSALVPADDHRALVGHDVDVFADQLLGHGARARPSAPRRDEDDARFLRAQPRTLPAAERDAIRQLATDLPARWNAPRTTVAERKEISRHLVERVVVDLDQTDLPANGRTYRQMARGHFAEKGQRGYRADLCGMAGCSVATSQTRPPGLKNIDTEINNLYDGLNPAP